MIVMAVWIEFFIKYTHNTTIKPDPTSILCHTISDAYCIFVVELQIQRTN